MAGKKGNGGDHGRKRHKEESQEKMRVDDAKGGSERDEIQG